MSLRRKQVVGMLAVLFVGFCLLPPRDCAAESAKAAKKRSAKRVSEHATRHRSSRHRYVSRRRSSYRYRLARLQPEPSRIEEIQQALIREGYLKQEATGKWDDATRAAMRAFQQANGFEVTGLPESKALMKLGLGPHPLPEDADPSLVGSARSSPPDTSSSSNTPSSNPDQR